MRITQSAFRFLVLGTVAAGLAACTTTTHEVEVVHDQPVHHHHVQQTSTAPADYGVVNQYDRQSR